MNKELRFKNNCLRYMKKCYLKLMDHFQISINNSNYCWNINSFLHFYMIFLPSQWGSQYLFFACNNKNLQNDVFTISTKILDESKQNGLLDLIADNTNEGSIKDLIEKKFIKGPISVISSSVDRPLFFDNKLVSDIKASKFTDHVKGPLYTQIKKLIYNEAKSNSLKDRKPNIVNVSLSHQRSYTGNDFRQIVRGMDSKQFTEGLTQCLNAYDRNEWYICATGLGGLIEQVMYKTIAVNKNYYEQVFNDTTKYNKLDKHQKSQFDKTKSNYYTIMNHSKATASYYRRLFKSKPINANDMSIKSIENVFNIRNGVDHFNTGEPDKHTCKELLYGMKMIYNKFFIKAKNLN